MLRSVIENHRDGCIQYFNCSQGLQPETAIKLYNGSIKMILRLNIYPYLVTFKGIKLMLNLTYIVNECKGSFTEWMYTPHGTKFTLFFGPEIT